MKAKTKHPYPTDKERQMHHNWWSETCKLLMQGKTYKEADLIVPRPNYSNK